jgi:hypothetical protein
MRRWKGAWLVPETKGASMVEHSEQEGQAKGEIRRYIGASFIGFVHYGKTFIFHSLCGWE